MGHREVLGFSGVGYSVTRQAGKDAKHVLGTAGMPRWPSAIDASVWWSVIATKSMCAVRHAAAFLDSLGERPVRATASLDQLLMQLRNLARRTAEARPTQTKPESKRGAKTGNFSHPRTQPRQRATANTFLLFRGLPFP